MIIIQNNDKEIKETNYYTLELNKKGKFYVSLNAGAFRLLIPDQFVENVKKELKLAKKIVITRKVLSNTNIKGFEILLDDGSQDPFIFEFSENSFDRIPSRDDEGKSFVFSAWVSDKEQGIRKIYENKCYYNRK